MDDIDTSISQITRTLQSRSQLALSYSGREPCAAAFSPLCAILAKEGLIGRTHVHRVDRSVLGTEAIDPICDTKRVRHVPAEAAERLWKSAPGNRYQPRDGFSGQPVRQALDTDRIERMHSGFRTRLRQRRWSGRTFREHRPIDGCVVKTAGVDESIFPLHREEPKYSNRRKRPAKAYSAGDVESGDVVVITLRGTRKVDPACKRCSTRPRTSKSRHLGKACALITDGRFSGGTSGLIDRTHLARSGRRRKHRT